MDARTPAVTTGLGLPVAEGRRHEWSRAADAAQKQEGRKSNTDSGFQRSWFGQCRPNRRLHCTHAHGSWLRRLVRAGGVGRTRAMRAEIVALVLGAALVIGFALHVLVPTTPASAPAPAPTVSGSATAAPEPKHAEAPGPAHLTANIGNLYPITVPVSTPQRTP